MSVLPDYTLHMISPQTEGSSSETPDTVGVDGFWFGNVSQQIWGIRDASPAAFVYGLRRAVPQFMRFRLAWHLNFFYEREPGLWAMLPKQEEFIFALVEEGFEIVLDWHDGPTQELSNPERHNKWPAIYPKIESRADVEMAMDGPMTGHMSEYLSLRERQTLGYNRMMDWLDRYPTVKAAVIGVELMNEPAEYLHSGNRYQDLPFFLGKMIDHIENMVGIVKSRLPGRFILAPAAGYNGVIAPLVETFLPDRGKSAFEAMKDVVGLTHMLLSVHYYPSFDSTVRNAQEHTREFTKRFSAAGEIPIVITEMNISWEWMMPDRPAQNAQRSWLRGRCLEWMDAGLWPGKKAIGICFWPFFNYAQNSTVRIQASGALVELYRHSMAQFYNHMGRDGAAVPVFGPLDQQEGEKDFEIIDLTGFNGVHAARWELDDWHLLEGPTWAITVNADRAVSWGGRGLTWHEPPDGLFYSVVIGGDGKSVVWDQDNEAYRRNYYMLGRGGGVVRMGPGSHAVVSQGGQCRVYTAPAGYASVSHMYGWDNQTIIHPDSTLTHVHGFDPTRGDQLSFMGAFATPQLLRGALETVPNGSVFKGEHLIVNLPNGGKVLLVDAGPLLARFHQYVLDFTAGWYMAPGWTEIPDIVAEDIGAIGPPIAPPRPDTGSPIYDRDGRSVSVLDRDGNPISFAV